MELQKVPPDVAGQAHQNKRMQRILKQKNYVPKSKEVIKPKINVAKILEQTGTEAFLPCDISKLNPMENSTVK